jgi:hypothetical protein
MIHESIDETQLRSKKLCILQREFNTEYTYTYTCFYCLSKYFVTMNNEHYTCIKCLATLYSVLEKHIQYINNYTIITI